MIRNYGEQYVRFDESVFEKIHPGWIQYRKRLGVSALLLLIAFFLSYPLFQWGRWGVLLFFLFIVISILNVLVAFFLKTLTVCIITNTRIIDIDRSGFFDKNVAELQLGHIQDIRYTTKGVFASVFGYGTVIIQASDGRGRMEIVNVKDPQAIQEMLLQIQRQHNRKKRSSQIEQ